MAKIMCNAINQNIEPFTEKLVNSYFEQFGTLINDNFNNHRNTLSQNLVHQNV